MFTSFDQQCMQRALELARMAEIAGEIPVGAIVTMNENILAEGYNQSIMQNDPTAHAEIIALRAAAQKVGNYRLLNATLYTTLEPCCMCAGALIHARIKRVVCATLDLRTGAGGSVFNILNSEKLNHVSCFEHGLLAEQSSMLLKQFFQERRAK